MKKKTEKLELESFGERLARLRRDAGYSQRALADEANISQRMVAYYESQGGRIPADTLCKLADALDITSDALLGRVKHTKKDSRPQNKRLLRKFFQIEKLPPRERESIVSVIDGMLVKHSVNS